MEHNSAEKVGYKRLTIERLRQFKGLENLTDEEAQESIEALEKLSVIMFELYQQEKAKKIGANSKEEKEKK